MKFGRKAVSNLWSDHNIFVKIASFWEIFISLYKIFARCVGILMIENREQKTENGKEKMILKMKLKTGKVGGWSVGAPAFL